MQKFLALDPVRGNSSHKHRLFDDKDEIAVNDIDNTPLGDVKDINRNKSSCLHIYIHINNHLQSPLPLLHPHLPPLLHPLLSDCVCVFLHFELVDSLSCTNLFLTLFSLFSSISFIPPIKLKPARVKPRIVHPHVSYVQEQFNHIFFIYILRYYSLIKIAHHSPLK